MQEKRTKLKHEENCNDKFGVSSYQEFLLSKPSYHHLAAGILNFDRVSELHYKLYHFTWIINLTLLGGQLLFVFFSPYS